MADRRRPFPRRLARALAGAAAVALAASAAMPAEAQGALAPVVGAWTDQGEAAASNGARGVPGDAHAAPLAHRADHDYRVTTFATVTGLAPGSYTLHATVRSSGGQRSAFVFARVEGFSLVRTALPDATDAQEIVVPGIPVTSDHVVVGLHSDARAGQWAELSNLRLERDARPRVFLAGGDVSVLPLLEKRGAHFSDGLGVRDPMRLLADHGFGIVRLRLYDQPGPGHGEDGWHWPAGSMDLPDVLALARRAQALGMQIELTLHESDFWTNSKTQRVPARWRAQLDALPDERARFARLVELVGESTREVMRALVAQGTPPQYVSIGNETEAGMLYPYGAATEQNWPRLAALLKAGYDGVKAVNPASQVVFHLDDGGNVAKYETWFGHARANGVKWDVIGASYYPFWTRKPVPELVAFCDRVSAMFDSDIMIMETGFNWSPARPGGWAGQLADNGPYPKSMSTPMGQRAYLNELFNGLKRAAGGRVVGVLYWDPVMIAAPGVGWADRDGDDRPGDNVVSNTALFDFDGLALPALDLWRDHAGAKPLRAPAAAGAASSASASAGAASNPAVKTP